MVGHRASAGAIGLLVTLGCSLLGPVGAANAANLITNGSFESPDIPTGSFGIFASIPGWSHAPAPQAASSSGIEIQDHVAGDPAPGAGDQYVELDSDGPSRIWQDVSTTPGTTYQLVFLYSPRRLTTANQNHFQVSAGPESATIGPLASASQNIWQSFTLDFTATASSSRIEFLDLGPEESVGGVGAYIDEVSVDTADARRMVTNGTVAGTKYASIVECNATIATNKARPFTVEWTDGTGTHRFKATSYSGISCFDSPSVPGVRPAGFDTQQGFAHGTVDGGPGFRVQYQVSDGGTGSANDSTALQVQSSDGSVLYHSASGTPTGGGNYALPPTS